MTCLSWKTSDGSGLNVRYRFYGDTDDEVKTETDKAGDTFLAEVCKGWEAEARRAEDAVSAR